MTPDDGAFALPGSAHVGRVALRVGSLDRVVPFYRDAVGFRVERDAVHARLATGDGSVLLLLREDPAAPDRPRDQAGLFHAAVRVPDRGALADALSRIRDSEHALTGASDHLVSEALYLRDPEGNGLEIYRDRARGEWPETDDGGVDMDTLPLDLDGLAGDASGGAKLPAGTDVGHVHLEVTDLGRAEAFYAGALGLSVRARYGTAAVFLAAGEYHHHVGLNTWNGRTEPAGATRGLGWFELVLPDGETLDAVRRRLADRGTATEPDGGSEGGIGGIVVSDPDGIGIRLAVEG